MTPQETGKLLAMCAAFDRRTIGDADVLAWHKVVGDLPYGDCETAVCAHYTEGTDWLMPAHVRNRVKAMRRDRLARAIVPAPDPSLADEPGRHKAALDAKIRRIADGRSVRLAIAAPVRDDGPPPEFTEARATLGPALPSRGIPGAQEAARRQVQESRAEREAREAPEAS